MSEKEVHDMNMREVLDKARIGIVAIHTSLKGKFFRWKLAQRVETKWWREHTYLFPWISRFKRFGISLDLDGQKSISDKNCLQWEKVVSCFGFNDVQTNKPIIMEIDSGTSGIIYTIKGEHIIKIAVDPLMDEYTKLDYYRDNVFNFNTAMNTHLHIAKARAEDLPVKSASIDVVFCINVLDHVEDPKQALKEVKRTLKNGGFFVLVVDVLPRRSLFTYSVEGAHPHKFKISNVRDLIKDFKIIQEGYEFVGGG